MSKTYSTSLVDVRRLLHRTLSNIEANTSLQMKSFVIRKRDYQSSITQKHNKYQIRIGIKSLYDHLNEQNQVTDKDFVYTVLSCFHEEQHLHQYEQFQNPNADTETKHFAHVDLIRHTFPETYNPNTTYWNNAMEIDAELFAIQKTSLFFKTYYPNIDVDGLLVDMIQKADLWYADNHTTTIEEAINNLEQALDASYTTPTPLQLRYYVPETYSKALQEFAKNPNNRAAYLSAYEQHDGKTTNQLLLDFIKENYPWKYKEYPCLQEEWNETIQNAKAPLSAKLQGLDKHEQRIQELESKFSEVLKETTYESDEPSLQ